MKRKFEEIKIEIISMEDVDIIKTSGEISWWSDDDESYEEN